MPAYTSPVRLLERDHPIDVLQTRAERAATGHGGRQSFRVAVTPPCDSGGTYQGGAVGEHP